MDNHQALHVGCQNEAYTALPRETGPDDLTLDEARAKLSTLDALRRNGFLENPSEDEMCDLLPDVARVMNAAGRVDRFLIARQGRLKEIKKHPRQGPAFGVMLNSHAMFRPVFKVFAESFPAWLNESFDPLHAACIDERMAFILKEGLRQGDKGLWKSCFQGRWIWEASSDAGSARTPNPYQDTNSADTAPDESNVPGFPCLVIPGGQDPNDPSVLDALTRLLESMAGQSAEPGPPSAGRSSAAPSAAASDDKRQLQ